MDAIEYLKTRTRMTNNCTINCDECLLHYKNNNHELYCNKLEEYYPKVAIQIVEEWGKEHPIITNAEKYKEIIKETFGDNLIDVCDKQVPNFKCSSFTSCDECVEFWNSEYKKKGE